MTAAYAEILGGRVTLRKDVSKGRKFKYSTKYNG